MITFDLSTKSSTMTFDDIQLKYNKVPVVIKTYKEVWTIRLLLMVMILISFFMSSCANVSSTRMIFKSENTTLMLDMPKEVEAEDLKITFNAQQGTFEITSKSWSSRSQSLIKAQSEREKAVLESSSVLLEKATAAAVTAAIKSAIPLP